MKVSGFKSFKGDFWLNPDTGIIYFTQGDEHVTFVYIHPEYFGIREKFAPDTEGEEILFEALKNGWVRGKFHETAPQNQASIKQYVSSPTRHQLNLQATDIRSIHKSLVIVSNGSEVVDELIYDVVKSVEETSFFFWRPENQGYNVGPLRGNRLEHFLRRGRLPSKMIRESGAWNKSWYNPKTDELYKFTGHHSTFISRFPELFNVERLRMEDNISIAIENGWVRTWTTNKILNVQSIDLRNAHRAIVKVADENPIINELNLEINEQGKRQYWLWGGLHQGRRGINLKGDRFTYFLKRGRIPTDMVKEAVFTFGRFNPPTKGHQKLMNKVMEIAEQNSADHFIFPTKTVDRKNNPLTFEDKVFFLKKITEANITELETPTIFGAMHWLEEQGYTDAIMVVGEDRLNEFNEMINHYRKDFSTKFKIESSGNRNESNTVEGISGTKVRDFVKRGDFNGFCSMVPLEENDAKIMYSKIHEGLKELTEAEKMRQIINTIEKEDTNEE